MNRWAHDPMAKGRGNGGTGRNRFTWDQFDGIPRLIRDVINYAPTNLGTERVWQALQGGASHQAVALAEIRMARGFAAQDTLAHYGPDHPQARRSASAA